MRIKHSFLTLYFLLWLPANAQSPSAVPLPGEPIPAPSALGHLANWWWAAIAATLIVGILFYVGTRSSRRF